VKLRDIQEVPVQIGIEFFKMDKINPGIIVAPTAFGKSIVIAFIAKGIKDKVLVIQPSKELLEQNYGKFTDLGGEASIYSASMNEKEIGDVTYATIGSILKVAQEFRKLGFTKVIIDECDRYPRNTSGQLRRFLDGARIKLVLGLTATPLKLQTNMGDDGPFSKLVMLTNPSKKGNFFNHILYVSQISEVVERGYWSKLEYQSYDFDSGQLIYNSTRADYTEDSMKRAYLNQNIDTKIINKVNELTDRKHILVAVPSVAQATDLAGRIPNAAIIHGGTPKKERKRIVDDFRSGKIRVVVQVDVLTIGFDFPELDCVITGRPTNSISWWYQFVGRGTRIHENKENCLIVDFVGSTQRFGKVEDLYFAETENGKWEMFGGGNKQITGLPMQKIGLILEGGIDLSKKIDENGDIEIVFIPFGKYKGVAVADTPLHYQEFMLQNFAWPEWTLKVKNEMLRLKEIRKR
jgi:DNA repair protein RadD